MILQETYFWTIFSNSPFVITLVSRKKVGGKVYKSKFAFENPSAIEQKNGIHIAFHHKKNRLDFWMVS